MAARWRTPSSKLFENKVDNASLNVFHVAYRLRYYADKQRRKRIGLRHRFALASALFKDDTKPADYAVIVTAYVVTPTDYALRNYTLDASCGPTNASSLGAEKPRDA